MKFILCLRELWWSTDERSIRCCEITSNLVQCIRRWCPSVIAQSIVPIIKDAGGAVLVRAPVSTLLFDDNHDTVIGVEVKGKTYMHTSSSHRLELHRLFQKLVPLSHHYLVEREVEGVHHPDIVNHISLTSMFIGLKTSEDGMKCGGIDLTSSLPSQNYWLFPTWDHSANWQEYNNNSDSNSNDNDNPLLPPPPAVFISFPSIKDQTDRSQ